ncbi:uncharacterized protein [Watersipora subatra]|uniref:uncharacterized protein isoform X2 n=1 Tax=Watersipora subatra TaxID=2589382 RepID=UPI00355C4A35
MTFVCRRCCRPASNRCKFFFTNCYHLICAECVRKCVVSNVTDSVGHHSITCPVEQKIRKVIPLEKLPPDARSLFSDVNKVLEENMILVKLLEKRLNERSSLIEYLSAHMKTILRDTAKLRKRISALSENGFICSRCGHSSFLNLNNSAGSIDSYLVQRVSSKCGSQNGSAVIKTRLRENHTSTRLSADSVRQLWS